MKKILIVAGMALTLATLTGCEGTITNWRGRNAVRTSEFKAQQMQIDADALIYYEKLNAEAILLRAESEAQAEVIRAQGIAEAMEIIKKELTQDYLIHFWIRTLDNHDGVIYVATELGLPSILGNGIND